MVIKGLNCLGIMGTSTFGGVELALIRTDGIDILERKKAYVVPYPDDMKEKIQKALSIKEKSRTPSKLNSFTFQNAPLRK